MAPRRKKRTTVATLAREVRSGDERIEVLRDELHHLQSAIIAHERSITVLSDHFEREYRIREAWRHRLMLDARILELLLALELAVRQKSDPSLLLAAIDALRAREEGMPVPGASLVTPEGA